jgi:two-component system nitrate/nitrite response regulator NarL
VTDREMAHTETTDAGPAGLGTTDGAVRTITMVVVDDHTMLRSALCDALVVEPDLEVVAQAGNGAEAVSMVTLHRPDIVLLDVEMPGQKVSDTVRQLGEESPQTHVLILSMYDDPHLVQELLALGVNAYLHKSASRATLLNAIRAVVSGEEQVIISVSRNSLTAPAPVAETKVAAGALSPRELEVLGYVAIAMSNRQIATLLSITEGTVKRHLRNIFAKLDAVSRMDAVNKATVAAIIGPPGAAPPS